MSVLTKALADKRRLEHEIAAEERRHKNAIDRLRRAYDQTQRTITAAGTGDVFGVALATLIQSGIRAQQSPDVRIDCRALTELLTSLQQVASKPDALEVLAQTSFQITDNAYGGDKRQYV